MRSRKSYHQGLTLIEAIVAVAILAAIAIPIATFFRTTTRQLTTSGNKLAAQQIVHRAFVMMDRDFLSMTLISSATPTFIEFRLDSNRAPWYNPDTISPDGIPWRRSPDIDGDFFTLPGPGIPYWTVGDNLTDEDDNSDNKIDVQCRYSLVGTDLIRDFSFDEEAWGSHTMVIAKGVVSMSFNYFAFPSTPGNEAMAVNGEGLVTDATINASSYGNGNTIYWDTQQERNRIDLVRIKLGCNPRKPSDTLSSDFFPVFLSVRRGRI